ncbi:[FeFe] hydrogenase, group A [Candidatus Gracilibacteria bacterium]|nr:[FeFe] hydrogenase, group A [Candidatus Gracilibacteria bacterium]
MTKVTIEINGKKYSAEKGESILQVAIRNNIEIPHFCHHEDLSTDANCRTCLVQKEGDDNVMTSCTLKAEEGLKVKTDTPKVKRLRRENMELLLAKYEKNAPLCKAGHFSKTLELMKKYGVKGDKYQRDEVCPLHKMGNAAEFDPSICIACNKCVEICEKIGINFLKLEGKNSRTRVTYNKDPKIDCIYCGQCTAHCPVAAVREQGHIDAVEKVLKDPNKIVIVQTAPSVRASIGEEFGVEIGVDLTEKLATAYRMMGFDHVFDVNMGADITTMVEAQELVERLEKNEDLPMFTSCCPGWVKFLEFYHPELIPHLTTARSPQIHSGGAYKTWWAEREGIDPSKIVVVSTMPCTSKKYEASFDKLKIDGLKPVDYVLTTRELAVMLKDRKIDLPNLKPSKIDKEGTYSGAAAIYGASGGVMESALRTAYFLLTAKELDPIEFRPVRGMEGIKKATVKIGKRKLKLGVVATAKYAREVIYELKSDPTAYDYIEFMACPGGCIGGGGQPIPSTERIVEQRIKGIYKIDHNMKMRCAHENPVVQEFMAYVKRLPEHKKQEILYTSFSQKKKFE